MKYKYTNELKGFNDTQTCICGNKVYINKQEVIGYDYNIRHIICYGVCSCGRKVIYFNKIIIDKFNSIPRKEECMMCGREMEKGFELIIEHHLNYEYNITTILCPSCHGKWHAKFKPIGISRMEFINSKKRKPEIFKSTVNWNNFWRGVQKYKN